MLYIPACIIDIGNKENKTKSRSQSHISGLLNNQWSNKYKEIYDSLKSQRRERISQPTISWGKIFTRSWLPCPASSDCSSPNLKKKGKWKRSWEITEGRSATQTSWRRSGSAETEHEKMAKIVTDKAVVQKAAIFSGIFIIICVAESSKRGLRNCCAITWVSRERYV